MDWQRCERAEWGLEAERFPFLTVSATCPCSLLRRLRNGPSTLELPIPSISQPHCYVRAPWSAAPSGAHCV